MKPWQLLLYGVLIGLLAAGAIILISRPVRGFPIQLSPAPSATATAYPKATSTPPSIQVQIKGEINQPGIYNLSKDSRLGELIQIAGGLTVNADDKRVNNAALLRDGDYFYIPALNEPIPETARNAPDNAYDTAFVGLDYPININEATQQELESLPGIGPTKASDIVSYRDQIGRFESIDQLLNVPGIGSATLEILREYLSISEE